MSDEILLHEALYRGAAVLARLREAKLVVCGAGAIGSLLVDNLVRQGAGNLRVIDRDRVEAHNIGTQLYRRDDVGAWKVEVLRTHCWEATGVEIATERKELNERTVARLLRDAELVVDAFDNSAGRGIVTAYCREQSMPCLHLGMNAGYGEAHWNGHYRVPADVLAPDTCEYPLARNLILLLVAIGGETVLRFLSNGEQRNTSATLRDLQINLEP